MIKNYWTIAFRALRHHRGYTFLNVAGLSIGMACCLLIALYIRHESTFDRDFPAAANVYRVAVNEFESSSGEQLATTPAPLSAVLEQEVPAIRSIARLFPGSFRMQHEQADFQERHVVFADTSALSMFGIELIQGDPRTALDQPFSLVLTPALATKYFGTTDVVGRTLTVNGQVEAQITGVMKPLPERSHLRIDALGGIPSVQAINGWLFDNWVSKQNYTYIRVDPGTDPAPLEARLNQVLDARLSALSVDQEYRYSISVEPLTRIYLESRRASQIGTVGSARLLYLLGAIGLIILALACINFVNLTTARATERAREVGVRKVVGAHQSQLIGQFLLESLLLSVVSIVLAFGIVKLALPSFETFIGADLSLRQQDRVWFGSVVALIALSVGLLAGSYPAFILSRFNAARVLKGFRVGLQGGTLRRVLVVSQFSIAVALIGATAIVFRQLEFMRSTDPGYAVNQLVAIDDIRNSEGVTSQFQSFMGTVSAQTGVADVALSAYTPADNTPAGGWNLSVETADGATMRTSFEHLPIDSHFLSTYQIDVIAGRGLSDENPADLKSSALINETAARFLGYDNPSDAIGKRITDTWPRDAEIVGVVADFNFRSLQQPIEPLVMRVIPDQFGVMTVRINNADVGGVLDRLRATWREFEPTRPFQYRFLDDAFAAQYQSEERFGQIFGLFAALAILIACLGLFGLAAYTAVQRTKEIGIRKVVGATVPQIVVLLSTDFAKLVLIGFAMGVPIAWLSMQSWLNGFAYRMTPSIVLFGAIGLAVLVTALLTVALQALRTASADPVTTLRYE